MSSIPLLLFAKAPIAGKVKTRLLPHCTPEQAADIAAILLEASLNLAVSTWPGKVLLSTWPDTRNVTLQHLADKHEVELVVQSEGDLGKKMECAMEQHGYPSAIMGSDAAMIEPRTLLSAHDLLASGENVIGPSEDGGYYLIGLNQPGSSFFKEMPWGTDTVLKRTLARQTKTQKLLLLPESYDIDTWADVQRARHRLTELDRYLSANND